MTRITGPVGKARRNRGRRCLSLLLTLPLMAANAPMGVAYSVSGSSSATDAQPAEPTPANLQQLVAPIALYPDRLVAQILAASTFPDQVVEADRWIQEHKTLQGAELATQVDAQSWDESVKALAQFPSVLANMDKNLSWTSALGDAYVNHQQDVMDAVQAMRGRARKAGNLRTTTEQNVVEQGSQITIEPANPEIVYVPEYDPWIVYGAPVVAWPGWYPYPGLFVADPGLYFGIGFGIGLFAGFGWGWGHWGCDWGHRTVVYNHNTYVSRSRTFANRQTFEQERGSFAHAGTGLFHGRDDARALGGSRDDAGFRRGEAGFGRGEQHAFAAPREAPDGHWGAFSGFDHGGATRGLSERGSSSFGGFHGGGFGGGFHGGFGGGFHGGGGGRR